MANAGGDTINSIKQANEFGIVRGGQKMIGLLTYISDVHGIGLQYAKGLILASAFYWDLTDETRVWTKRFIAGFSRRCQACRLSGHSPKAAAR